MARSLLSLPRRCRDSHLELGVRSNTQNNTQLKVRSKDTAVQSQGGAGRPLPGGSFIRSLPLLGEQWAQSSIAIAIMAVLCLRWARRRRGNDGGERRPLSQDRAPSAGSSVRYDAAKAARQLTTLGTRCMEATAASQPAARRERACCSISISIRLDYHASKTSECCCSSPPQFVYPHPRHRLATRVPNQAIKNNGRS